MQVFSQLGRLPRQENEPILYDRGLRMQAHDLVVLRSALPGPVETLCVANYCAGLPDKVVSSRSEQVIEPDGVADSKEVIGRGAVQS